MFNETIFTRFLDNQNLLNRDSLQLKGIFSIIKAKDGKIWFAACQSEGVSAFDGKTLSNIIPYKDVGRTNKNFRRQKMEYFGLLVFSKGWDDMMEKHILRMY